MKIYYNCMGDRRKSLVGALSQELNSTTQYLGAPSFQYEIGEYFIEKDGTVTGPDNSELVEKLAGHGFIGEVEYDDDVPAPATTPERLSIEMPMTGFTPEKLDNLTKIITAKSALLRMALGAEDLPIRQTDEDGGKLCFPWFEPDSDADHVQAYATLIERLCMTAKEKKRVTAKEKEIQGSPKYAMRCVLLSLGFIGDEYKSARKILLSKMPGSSSRKEVTGDE